MHFFKSIFCNKQNGTLRQADLRGDVLSGHIVCPTEASTCASHFSEMPSLVATKTIPQTELLMEIVCLSASRGRADGRPKSAR
jgi:hypothetical protein